MLFTVNADPVVVISGDNIVCENGTISLNANVTNGTATTYTWYNYNTQVPGATANLVVDPAQFQLTNRMEYTAIL
jgi:hypothetical protein